MSLAHVPVVKRRRFIGGSPELLLRHDPKRGPKHRRKRETNADRVPGPRDVGRWVLDA